MILGMNLGPHALFIEASYIVTIVIVAALVLWIVLDYAAQRRVLGDLDARGIRRRSQNPRDDTP
jgi:heme exporter protein D